MDMASGMEGERRRTVLLGLLFSDGPAARVSALVLATAVLLVPALVNGYPLMFPDSGSYLALALAPEDLPYRTLVYPALISLLQAGSTLWGVVIGQALIVAWLLDQAVALTVHRARTVWLAGLAIGLTLCTGLPWYVGQVMPDVFAGTLILAFGLLAAFGDRLPAWRKAALAAIIGLSTAVHPSHLLLALALLGGAVVAGRMLRSPAHRIALPAIAVLCGLLAVPLVHFLETGRAYLHKSGEIFVFARLVEDGIVSRYLDEHCPKPEIGLCAFRDRLPSTHNAYLWDQPDAFRSIGGWRGSGPESRMIILETLRLYPAMHAGKAFSGFLRQALRVRSGDYLNGQNPYSTAILEIALPWEASAYHSALQQRGRLPFDTLNFLHVPVQLGAVVLLAWLGIRCWRSGRRQASAFCGLVLVGLMANALTCATLSNTQDRYQSRVVWVAVLAAGVLVRQRTPAPRTDGTAESGTRT